MKSTGFLKLFLREYLGLFLVWVASAVTFTACIGIFAYVFINGISHVSPSFIFSEPNPTMNAANSGGISTPIIGTLLLTIIGMIIAFPWSLAGAIYLSEYAKKDKLTGLFRIGIDVLSGVPTIVIAIFGIALFTNPMFSGLSFMIHGINRAFGRSFLVAGITMAIMVLPFIMKTCEEALKSVQELYREASIALGASKWQTTVKVVVPTAFNGIMTAATIGMGRIIGETVIVWLTLGATLRMTGQGDYSWWNPLGWFSILRGTGSTLTSYIYYTSPAGEGNLPSNAFGAMFILLVIIVILNLIVNYFSYSSKNFEED